MAYTHHSNPHPLTDIKQSAWQLTSIQMSGWTSLPILATSIAILQVNSFLGAILTIILGNIILWFIRLGIVSMSSTLRQSTLDVARDYLGQIGGYFIAVFLLFSTFSWFIAQTTTGSHSITHLLQFNENPNVDQFTQVGVLLGTLSTLCCMGGIVLLRRLSTISFPLILSMFIVILFLVPAINLQQNPNTLSLEGLTLVLVTNLGITSDLPTFFRHSRSWKTSVNAITLIQLFSIALGIGSLYFGSIIAHGLEISQETIHSTNREILKIPLICFVFLSVICANVANVYSASVGWELIAPKSLVGRKEYFILGLGLTTIFILVSDFFSLSLFLKIADSSLINLCIVLILGYVIGRQKQRLPDRSEKFFYFIAWLISLIVNILQYGDVIMPEYSTVFIGFVVIIIFITLSYIRKILCVESR